MFLFNIFASHTPADILSHCQIALSVPCPQALAIHSKNIILFENFVFSCTFISI